MPAQAPSSARLPRGFRAAGVRCGLKPSGKQDLALIASNTPCTAAGVFTTNQVKGAPVLLSQRHIRNGRAQAIVVNAGIANVATGAQGLDDAAAMCQATGDALGVAARDVLVASTGVIGRALPMEKLLPGIDAAAGQLSAKPSAWPAAARAIMTTDTVPKLARRSVGIGGKRVTLTGIAKGAGMIAPNMATMLGFILTDAAINAPTLRAMLKDAVKQTFNRMSIDSDQSTSDMVLVLANGQAEGRPVTGPGKALTALVGALTGLCDDLCCQLVTDGEGIEHVIRCRVTGAASVKDADRVGRSVIDSPLVKTAIHGADPNWGRIAMAVGKSQAKINPDRLSITIAGMTVFANGQPTPLGLAPTAALARAMKKPQVRLDISLGNGPGTACWLGGDLSRAYIRINADYTT